MLGILLYYLHLQIVLVHKHNTVVLVWCTSDTIGDEPKKPKSSIVFPNSVLLFILLFLLERRPVAFVFSAVVRMFVNEQFALLDNVIK